MNGTTQFAARRLSLPVLCRDGRAGGAARGVLAALMEPVAADTARNDRRSAARAVSFAGSAEILNRRSP
jgi:hypothetical protein